MPTAKANHYSLDRINTPWQRFTDVPSVTFCGHNLT